MKLPEYFSPYNIQKLNFICILAILKKYELNFVSFSVLNPIVLPCVKKLSRIAFEYGWDEN